MEEGTSAPLTSIWTSHFDPKYQTMVKFYDEIPQNLAKWMEIQQLFWVASAPLSGEGHVNLSPKGLRGTFHIANPNRVWYEDCTGSGELSVRCKRRERR